MRYHMLVDWLGASGHTSWSIQRGQVLRSVEAGRGTCPLVVPVSWGTDSFHTVSKQKKV
ncbi:MAG: hypothetical protein ACQEV7_09415 [Bacillota bacterium]